MIIENVVWTPGVADMLRACSDGSLPLRVEECCAKTWGSTCSSTLCACEPGVRVVRFDGKEPSLEEQTRVRGVVAAHRAEPM